MKSILRRKSPSRRQSTLVIDPAHDELGIQQKVEPWQASIVEHIRSLESYVERSGARLVRAVLPESVHGRVFGDLIILRVDLEPQQELLTLVHELAHWLAHRGARAHQPFTVFEYEAEAVEAIVMARLGLPRGLAGERHLNDATPTDDLLSASVTRVIWASSCICDALGVGAGRRASQP